MTDELSLEQINRGLAAVDAAKHRHPAGSWDALADFGLRPASFIAYAQQQAVRLATHGSAFDVDLDSASFVAGWLDGLMCGAAIAQAQEP